MLVGKCSSKYVSTDYCRTWLRTATSTNQCRKEFLPGVAGCHVEHSQLLMKALFDARRNAKELIVVWQDIANAYGSVTHNLILYALEWYHIRSCY